MIKNFCFAPVLLSGIAVVLAHGGNDKAPFLVLFAALFSLVLGLLYIVKSFMGPRGSNMKKAMIALLPFAFTAAIFLLAKLALLDPMPILGFR